MLFWTGCSSNRSRDRWSTDTSQSTSCTVHQWWESLSILHRMVPILVARAQFCSAQLNSQQCLYNLSDLKFYCSCFVLASTSFLCVLYQQADSVQEFFWTLDLQNTASCTGHEQTELSLVAPRQPHMWSFLPRATVTAVACTSFLFRNSFSTANPVPVCTDTVLFIFGYSLGRILVSTLSPWFVCSVHFHMSQIPLQREVLCNLWEYKDLYSCSFD